MRNLAKGLKGFVGKPNGQENKQTKTAGVTLPIYCRNATEPLKFILFRKDKHQLKVVDDQHRNGRGELVFRQDF
jgi:hypothetical protein